MAKVPHYMWQFRVAIDGTSTVMMDEDIAKLSKSAMSEVGALEHVRFMLALEHQAPT